jgi:hypothetical protein
MTWVKPPKKVTLKFCPVCGRTDRHMPFTGNRHFHHGQRCAGELTIAEYVLKGGAPQIGGFEQAYQDEANEDLSKEEA